MKLLEVFFFLSFFQVHPSSVNGCLLLTRVAGGAGEAGMLPGQVKHTPFTLTPTPGDNFGVSNQANVHVWGKLEESCTETL